MARQKAYRMFEYNKMMDDRQIQEIIATLMSVSTKADTIRTSSAIEDWVEPLPNFSSNYDSQFESESDPYEKEDKEFHCRFKLLTQIYCDDPK